MNDFIIGLDVDGVIADFVSEVLYYQNNIFKTNFKPEDVLSPKMEDLIGNSNLDLIVELFEKNHSVKKLSLYQGAKTLVEELKTLGRLVFVTAPFYNYYGWCDDRYYWLSKHFCAKKEDVLFLYDKSMFIGNVLIDDFPRNINNWIKTNRPAIRVVRPWNKNGNGIPAENLFDIPNIIKNIKSGEK